MASLLGLEERMDCHRLLSRSRAAWQLSTEVLSLPRPLKESAGARPDAPPGTGLREASHEVWHAIGLEGVTVLLGIDVAGGSRSSPARP
jgi:hypothetical protein